MNDLKVNMYVRTKKGSIAKILGVDYSDEFGGLEISNILAVYFDTMIDGVDKDIYKGCMYLLKDCKASFNIIDLIEAGDYVNGEQVKYIEKYERPQFPDDEYGIFTANMWLKPFKLGDIKAILTKEQFNSLEYKVVK
jgi:hypothetical protein